MPEKSPETYSLITYIWVVLLAAWGGFNNYISRVKAGHIDKFSFMEFAGEMSISAFSGILSFYVCEWAALPSVATAAIVGVSGHMGGRTIFLFEQTIKRQLGVDKIK